MEQNNKNKIREILINVINMVSHYFILFYYFLKRLFSYDAFIESIIVKENEDNDLQNDDYDEDEYDEDEYDDYDEHDLEFKETRTAAKQTQLNNFYKFFTFPHLSYANHIKAIRSAKRKRKVYIYKNYYLPKLIGAKHSVSALNSVNDKLSYKKSVRPRYFNVTNSNYYYYINKSRFYSNPELVNFFYFDEPNAESRAEIIKVLKVRHKFLSLDRSIPALNNFVNLNLILKDYNHVLNSIDNNVELTQTLPAVKLQLKRKMLKRTAARYIFEIDTTLKLLTYRFFNNLKLYLLKFPKTRDYFFKQDSINIHNTDENIYYDLIFDKQFNNSVKPLPVINLYNFYSTGAEPVSDFYFFKKLRLLDAFFYINFDDIDPEQRYKLFSTYYNNHSVYNSLVKNFKFYKVTKDKNLVFRFNFVAKNLPYMKDFLKYDLPFNRELEESRYYDPEIRLSDDGATYLKFDDFLKLYYYRSFLKIKATYFSNLKTIYKSYKKSKLNFTYLKKYKTKNLRTLKYYFDKPYNFNFVDLKPAKLYSLTSNVSVSFLKKRPAYYTFGYFAIPEQVKFKQSFLTSKFFGVNYSYFSNNEEQKESLLNSVVRSNFDHLDIPLFFTDSFLLHDAERLSAVNLHPSNKDFVITLKATNLKKLYEKLSPKAKVTIKQQVFKKGVRFNNKVKLPNFVDSFFLFNFLPFKVNLVKKKKQLNADNIFKFYFFSLTTLLFITLVRVLFHFINKSKVEKIFLSLCNIYSNFLCFLLIVFFFVHFFSNFDFFVVSNYILIYFAFTKFHSAEVEKVDIEMKPEQESKLNFSYFRYATLKNFYRKHFVNKEQNDNFLFNEKGRKLEKNLAALKYFEDNIEEETEVQFDETQYRNQFLVPDLTKSILFVLSISWFDFYILNFVLFLTLFFFKVRLSTKDIKYKVLYIVLAIIFEMLLLLFFYLYYSEFIFFGHNVSFFCNFILSSVLLLLSYTILKIK